MKMNITPNIINSIGLFFDILGAWFVAIEIVYQYKGKTHNEPTIYCNGAFKQDEIPEYTKDKKIKHKAMKFGLALLTAGFVLQIISNHLPMELNKTSTKSETTLQYQKAPKKHPENNQLPATKLKLKEKPLTQI